MHYRYTTAPPSSTMHRAEVHATETLPRVCFLQQQNGSKELSLSQTMSISSSLLAVPRTLTNYGDRSFAVYGPRVWNSLPDELRSPDITLTTFRNKLKTLDRHCEYCSLIVERLSAAKQPSPALYCQLHSADDAAIKWLKTYSS